MVNFGQLGPVFCFLSLLFLGFRLVFLRFFPSKFGTRIQFFVTEAFSRSFPLCFLDFFPPGQLGVHIQ